MGLRRRVKLLQDWVEEVVHGVKACKQSRILANINLKLSKTYVMSSFQELRDLFLLSYENGSIDDNEFSVLHDEFKQNPDLSYEEHDMFLLEEMKDAEFSALYNLKRPSRYKILS